MLTNERRQVAAAACVVIINELITSGVKCSEEEFASLQQRTRTALAHLKQMVHVPPGRGLKLRARLPTLSLPKSQDSTSSCSSRRRSSRSVAAPRASSSTSCCQPSWTSWS